MGEVITVGLDIAKSVFTMAASAILMAEPLSSWKVTAAALAPAIR